ncbi:MAG: LCP family protein, partial [Oscillospiraceae bacterium]|nr:LCP family protein [Oscillospiraceae bacterium]
DLVIGTIEYHFGVKIDNYVLIGFDAFKEIIDYFGGINMDVSKAEAEAMAKFDCVVAPGDNVLLNGEEALWYSRIRKLDSDFKRTERQRAVASKIIEKARKSNLVDLVSVANKIAPSIETDLPQAKIYSLGASAVFSYLKYEVIDATIPAPGLWKSETFKSQSILRVDIEKNREYLAEFLYGIN